MNLYELTTKEAALETALIENGGELTDELAGMLTELGKGLPAKVDGCWHILVEMKARADAADKEIKRLQTIKRAAENGAKRLKSYIVTCMEAGGMRKLEGKTCTMSLRGSKTTDADDTTLLAPFAAEIHAARQSLPDYIAIEFKIDKTALRDRLDKGEVIEGARVVENTGLTIR